MAFLAVSWGGFFYLHPESFIKVGANHYRLEIAPNHFHEIWFLDLFAILASNEAVAAGQDAYTPNPLDYQRRPHVYGPWWLELHRAGLTRADKTWLGLAIVGAFFAVAMSWLRPRDLRSLLWYLAVFCTTAMLLALERANNDLVIFLVLSPLVPCLLSPLPAVRWLALPLIGLAAELKFYPALAGVLLLAPAAPRELRWRLAAGLALLALVGWHMAPALARTVPLLPQPAGVMTFGSTTGFDALGWRGPGAQAAALAMGAVLGIMVARRRWFDGWEPTPAQRSEWLHFVLGATLLTGCFFAGKNFSYRWVFALWLAPLLWSLSTAADTPVHLRRLARVTGGLLLFVLWHEPLWVFLLQSLPEATMARARHWISWSSQPFTWAFFTCLLAFLLHFFQGAARSLFRRG